MEKNINVSLGCLKIIVTSHIFADGPAQALVKYLTKNNPAEKVLFIGHPLLPRPNQESLSSIQLFTKGKEVQSKEKRNIGQRFSLHYLENFSKTVYWVLSSRDTWNIYIGANNLNALSGIVLKFFGKVDKVIFYCVDYAPKRFNNPIVNFLYHLVDKIAVNLVDEIWNLSPRMNEAREKVKNLHTDSVKCKIVPMGIWFEEIKRIPFNKVNKHDLVFMGHLLKKQGIQLIIKAIPLILKEIPDFKFLIIGKGEYEDELKQLVKDLSLEKKVSFLGYIADHENMENILAKCGGAVALYEKGDLEKNFTYYADPGKIKDYLGAGLPVIMTDIPHNAYDIQRRKCGLIVENKEKEIISAIVKLFNNESVLKKYKKNAVIFAKDYDWNKIYSKAFGELY